MGCTDRGSNFNALIFFQKEQRWMCEWSGDQVSIEAPLREMVVEKIASEYGGSSLDEWDITQVESGNFKAIRKTLIGGN